MSQTESLPPEEVVCNCKTVSDDYSDHQCNSCPVWFAGREARIAREEKESGLLRCPFCGNTPETDHIEAHKHHFVDFPAYPGSWSVECAHCEFRIFSHESLADASAKWNQRI